MLKRTSLALLLAVVLMLSLFPVGVFAEDADAVTVADTTEATPEDTTQATDDASDADDGHDHDHEEEKKFGLSDIISLAVLAVIIIAVVIYCLTHKEKVGKLVRGLVSEFKKIVWTPWNQVRKNTLVVLVVVIATALVIALVDTLFSQSIFAIGRLI